MVWTRFRSAGGRGGVGGNGQGAHSRICGLVAAEISAECQIKCHPLGQGLGLDVHRVHLGRIHAQLLLEHWTGVGATDAKLHLGHGQIPDLRVESGGGVVGLLAQRGLATDRVFDVRE